MKTIVLGPPGTGKTWTLLNKVEDYLKNTDPDKVGYFAFTRKAANEAKGRAMDKFNLSEDDLPYFRTLHSLAFRRLGINKNQVMQKRHYEDLGKKLNLFIDYNEYDEEETGIFTTKSDYLRLIHLAKLREISLEKQFKFGEHNTEVDYDTLVHLSEELQRYKKEYGLVDFNDMILNFIKANASTGFPSENCFVIEDSTNGIQAAKTAGLFCVGFDSPHSKNQDYSNADLTIQSFKEIEYLKMKSFFE